MELITKTRRTYSNTDDCFVYQGQIVVKEGKKIVHSSHMCEYHTNREDALKDAEILKHEYLQEKNL